MDIARFHFAVNEIIDDLKATATNEQLASLVNALSAVISQPGQHQFVDRYRNQLEETRGALQSSSLNNPKMEVADLIQQINLEGYIGNGLFERIIKTISKNQVTPYTALEALQSLQVELSQKITNLEAIKNSFAALEIPCEGENEGDSEIEINIPATQKTKTLSELAAEAKEWNRDIDNIAEIFDPDRSTTTIKTIATGSWQFYLAAAPLVIFGFAKCLKGINEILQELITAKELLKRLTETKAPANVIGDYENHLIKTASTNITVLASSLVNEYYKGGDDGRKEELKNALTQSLKRLSKKISEGSKINLRLTKPTPTTIENPANLTPDEAEAIESEKRNNEIYSAVMIELEGIEKLENHPDITKSLPPPDTDSEE